MNKYLNWHGLSKVFILNLDPPEGVKGNVTSCENTATGECTTTAMWNPPTNMDQENINHYMVYINSTDVHKLNHTKTGVTFPDPNCSATNVSVGAVSLCGFAGPVTKLMSFAIAPSICNDDTGVSRTEFVITSRVTASDGVRNNLSGK